MKDEEKTKEQLISDLTELRRQVDEARRLQEISSAVQGSMELDKTLEKLEEKNRLLTAYHQIGHSILSSLDVEQVLDNLAEQIVEAGIFRSLTVSLVNEPSHTVEIVRNLTRHPDGRIFWDRRKVVGTTYNLDDDNMTTEVARTGQMEVVEGWDDRFDRQFGQPESTNYENRVAYFLPVKHGDRVLAVLATGSRIKEKEEVLHRIEVMRPLLDQVVIALEHARLFKEAQEHAQDRVRLERLSALGEIAQGVAHNFNNILVGVIGNAELIQMKATDSEVVEEADDLVKSTLRAKELVRRLTLSIQGEGEKMEPVQVNRAVQEAVQAAQPRWKDEPESRGVAIEVVTELEGVPPIRGTQAGLHDILLNLLFNAVDAMPEGGRITIGAQAVEEGVQITLADTGVGMDDETCRRVFEPFFTTKADVGSGLGLSTIHGAITRWEGAIEVESRPGQGTAFTLRLPIWTDIVL